MTERDGILITDGTDQRDRLPDALRTGYFLVDEMSFEDLLAMSSRLASALNYFDLNNRRSGTWGDLFSSNGVAIMATILSTDISKLERSFSEAYRTQSMVTSSLVYSLARTIDEWFKGLVRSDEPAALILADKIAGLIDEKLAGELHSFADINDCLCSRDESVLSHDFSGFDSVWGVQYGDKVVSYPRSKVSPSQDSAHLMRIVRGIHYNLLHGISYLQSITGVYMKDALISRGNDPAVGLFISFLKLFGHVQQRINRFTDRHLDFYYNEILKRRPRNAEPESVYLLLEPEVSVEKCFIPSGTAFYGCQNDEEDTVVYEACHDLLLTHGRVELLYTLSLQKNTLISPERELSYVTTVTSDALPLGANNAQDLSDKPYLLFGAGRDGREGAGRDSDIGFAIASPLLFLQEGMRKIEVEVQLIPKGVFDPAAALVSLCQTNSEQDFFSHFGRMFAGHIFSGQKILLANDLQNIKNKAKTVLDDFSYGAVLNLLEEDRELLFTKLLKRLFRISLSVQGGWHHKDDYVILPLTTVGTEDDYGFTLTLELEPEVEPIVACEPDAHGTDWEDDVPVLRLLINPQADFYPYSLLESFELGQIIIEASVKGAKDIIAYNNLGRLDPSKPFHPFGPLPVKESYLIVGHREAVRKRLVSLKLRFVWNDLPGNYGGFKEYYSGYGEMYHNDAFVLRQQVLQDGEWQPGQEGSSGHTYLFEKRHPGDMIKKETTVDVNILGYYKPIPATSPRFNYTYGLKTRRGFFRFVLECPHEAFGHHHYPALLTKILSHNSTIKKKPIPLPNKPYTPLLGEVSLDYVARCIIDVREKDIVSLADSPDKIFHIHPFGTRCVSKSGLDSFSLIPEYRHAAHLFIGLSGVSSGGVVSLFFHVAEDVKPDVIHEKTGNEWCFLSKNGWLPLEKSRVILDSTSGFLTSGVVKLNIPESVDSSNSLMPTGYYWLKVSNRSDLQSCSRIYAVQTNGLMLRRKIPHEDSSYLSRATPKANLWKPVTPIAGLGGVIQPVRSFGGRPPESREQLKIRTSERLRHKNRSSLAWDYERLILDRFPGLMKVKCFPHLNTENAGEVSPGHVCIVVVPLPQGVAPDAWRTAMVDGLQLSRIRDFVQSHTSEFVKVEVRNPVYERVQVRCTVKLKDTRARGRYITRLNQDISDYMSPWRSGGYSARFGWSIRQKDIEAHIRALEYVDFVTNFSMLHIFGRDEELYGLVDSATFTGSGRVVISPHYPWSLAIPMKNHFIETIDGVRAIQAEVTGIGELEIGGTLILEGGRNVA